MIEGAPSASKIAVRLKRTAQPVEKQRDRLYLEGRKKSRHFNSAYVAEPLFQTADDPLVFDRRIFFFKGGFSMVSIISKEQAAGSDKLVVTVQGRKVTPHFRTTAPVSLSTDF